LKIKKYIYIRLYNQFIFLKLKLNIDYLIIFIFYWIIPHFIFQIKYN